MVVFWICVWKEGCETGLPVVVFWIYVWEEDCEIGLPMVVFILFLVDSRVLAGHSGSCGGFLHVARVVLSICTAG